MTTHSVLTAGRQPRLHNYYGQRRRVVFLLTGQCQLRTIKKKMMMVMKRRTRTKEQQEQQQIAVLKCANCHNLVLFSKPDSTPLCRRLFFVVVDKQVTCYSCQTARPCRTTELAIRQTMFAWTMTPLQIVYNHTSAVIGT